MAPYNTDTSIWDADGPFIERIAPGAFAGCLGDSLLLSIDSLRREAL